MGDEKPYPSGVKLDDCGLDDNATRSSPNVSDEVDDSDEVKDDVRAPYCLSDVVLSDGEGAKL